MITPISNLVENTKCLAKISKFCGSTVLCSQNLVGDWTEMTTIKWPIFIILLIACMCRAGAESKTLGGQTYWEVEILGGQLGGQY